MNAAMAPELVALVVHDLKNALGSLEASLGTLAAEPRPDLAQRAHRHCRELRQRFVMFLMLYGNQGTMHAWRTDESPQDFLQALQARNASPAGAAALRLAPWPQDLPAFWFFDPRLVGLALDAALHNAGRFARREIVLGARRDGERLVFWIADDGPGLGTADASEHRTGLGTTLCRAVAEVHDGALGLVNRPEGGALFELALGG